MFKRKQLATAVIFALGSTLLHAQEADNAQEETPEDVEVIEVSGIRASLNKAINIHDKFKFHLITAHKP